MPTFIEVCSGAGGLSSGLLKAGFTPLLLNDNNKDCCETLKLNHKKYKNIIVCSSMLDLDLSDHIGKVDLLTGGIPCQSYSMSGKRKGLEDPRGNLMIVFADMLNTLKPKIFMIENVKGLLSHNKGETLKIIIKELNKNNFYNIKYKVLNANDFEVPQKRERIFIIGTLKNLPEYEYPKEVKGKKKVLKDVLYNVPPSEGAKYPEEKVKLFKLIPQGGCWINLPEDLQKSYMGNSYFSGGGKRGILHRLSMEKPSLTLLCSPSQKQTERCFPLEERPLTVREYARIQSFPDDYKFFGSMSSQYKQIGNAVPVLLAYHIGKSLIKYLK